MAEIRQRAVPSRRRRDGLIRHARDSTSQNGEDGVIARLLELLPPSQHQDRPGRSAIRYCVDVGAWDGRHLSNTYSLLVHDQQQSQISTSTSAFRGVLIEADPVRFVQLEELYRPLGNTCVNVAVSCAEGSKHSLSAILGDRAPDLPKDFDFLCIDVDGTDYWLMVDVLEGGFRPSILCIEFNPTMPDDIIYIQPRDDGVRHGSSLAALVELAKSKNYVLVETTLFNAFFVPRELYDQYLKEEVPDTTIEALHEITMGTNLYQLYDGTIKLSGCKKMLWHRIPIKEEKIQILPKEKRSFPFAPLEAKSNDVDTNELNDIAVDMSSYCQLSKESGDTDKAHCASKLLQQLKSDGFAFVRGTGISAATCSKALRATNAFLHEADENVRRSCLTKDRARRGFAPAGTENFASLIGEKGNNDLVKKYRIGAVTDDADATSSCLLRPNVWPSEEVWTEEAAQFFRQSIEQYFEEQCRVTKAVVRAICDGLIASDGRPELNERLQVLREDHGESEAQQDTSILTLLNYKRGRRHQKSKKPQPLVAPHTDVGVITCLLFDKGNCAVLQRAETTTGAREVGADRKWIDVRLPPKVPDDPIFVVNIGDCFSELCGGTIPSTIHRVMPKDDGTVTRNCLALFHGLSPADDITLPSGERMTYEGWRKNRIARAATVLKENPN